MLYITKLEKALNKCCPPLTFTTDKQDCISITSGHCNTPSCASLCPFRRSDELCVEPHIISSWPKYFPDIAKQFPELLL